MNQQLLDLLVERKVVEFDKSTREYVFITTRVIGVVFTIETTEIAILESIYINDEDSFIGVDFKGKKYDLNEADFDVYTSGMFDKKDRII